MRPASVRMALYTLRATFERRVREYVVVVILVGLLGGLALAAVAGARRTQSSYASYLASTNPSDLDVFAGFANPALGSSVGYDPGTAARLARLPGVRDVQTVVGFAGNIDQVQGLHPHPVAGGKPAVFEGSLDGEYTTQDRATLVAGSWPDPTDAHQVMLNVGAAAEAGLHLGSTVTVSLNSDAQEVLMSSPTGPSNLPPVKVARLTVVGLVTLPQDVDIDDYDSLGSGTILLTPALTRQIAVCCATYSYAFMKLTDGTAHVGAVEAEVSRLHLPTPNVGGFQTHAPALARADRAIKPVSVSLGVFGALAAISLFLVGVQVFGRQLRRHATETAALRALGAGPGARTLDATLGLLGAVAVGGAAAVVVALALSPLFPLGPVRPVVPASLAADWTVLGLGFVVLVLVLGATALATAAHLDPSRVLVRRTRFVSRPAAAARLASEAGLGVPAVTGIRFATQPGELDPVPVRSAIVGAALAVVVILGTVVFGASLNNLVTHPALYGWNWNDALLSGFSGDEDLPAHQSATLLAHDPYVSAASGVYFAKARINGQLTGIMGATPHAAVAPPILSGQGLGGSNQIVVGPATLQALGAHVGGTVVFTAPRSPTRRLTVVGTTTLPAIMGDGMGTGAIVDFRLIPPEVRNTQGNAVPGPNAYLVRTTGPPAAALGSLDRIANVINNPNSPSPGSAGGAVAALRPVEIVDSHSIVVIPGVLGAGLALGAAVALGITLVASVRRRRRDFAVLKTLGLSGRQLGGIVAWQSSVTVLIGTLVGVPLGIVVGHVLWNAFAEAIDAVPVTSVPVGSVVAIAVGAVVLANVVAAVPARLAARTRTAVLLRSE